MKKIACALFITLGLVAACKKKEPAPATYATLQADLTTFGCKPASSKADALKLHTDATAPGADKAKVVLADAAVSVPCPATTKDCPADGKLTQAAQVDACVNTYQGLVQLADDQFPAAAVTPVAPAAAAVKPAAPAPAPAPKK